MVIGDLELWCLSGETVPWPSDLWRAFLPFMNQVQKCSYTVLRPTTKVSGEKQSLAINQFRQHFGKSILTRLRMGRKIVFACLLLHHLLPGVFLISSSLWYCSQIIRDKFIRKIIWGNFLFLFFLNISKRPGMVQMILPSILPPSVTSSFLQLYFPFNADYCLGPGPS